MSGRGKGGRALRFYPSKDSYREHLQEVFGDLERLMVDNLEEWPSVQNLDQWLKDQLEEVVSKIEDSRYKESWKQKWGAKLYQDALKVFKSHSDHFWLSDVYRTRYEEYIEKLKKKKKGRKAKPKAKPKTTSKAKTKAKGKSKSKTKSTFSLGQGSRAFAIRQYDQPVKTMSLSEQRGQQKKQVKEEVLDALRRGELSFLGDRAQYVQQKLPWMPYEQALRFANNTIGFHEEWGRSKKSVTKPKKKPKKTTSKAKPKKAKSKAKTKRNTLTQEQKAQDMKEAQYLVASYLKKKPGQALQLYKCMYKPWQLFREKKWADIKRMDSERNTKTRYPTALKQISQDWKVLKTTTLKDKEAMDTWYKQRLNEKLAWNA